MTPVNYLNQFRLSHVYHKTNYYHILKRLNLHPGLDQENFPPSSCQSPQGSTQDSACHLQKMAAKILKEPNE